MADHHQPCPYVMVPPPPPSPPAQTARGEQAQSSNRCPRYEDKVVANPTTARMLLMFLRDFVEAHSVYTQWPQNCFCPMMKCCQAFSDPLSLIDHLLHCPELPRGEFECWKCNNWHGFPTNEKDWADWLGWKTQQAPAGTFQRKLRETLNLRRRSSIGTASPPHQPGTPSPKQQPPPGAVGAGMSPEWGSHLSEQQMKRACQLDLRPAGGIPYGFASHQAGGSDSVDMTGYSDCQSVPGDDDTKMGQLGVWPDIEPDEMCDISTTPSAIFDQSGASQPNSSKTSQTSLFVPSMTDQFHQQLVQQLSSQQYMLSPQLTECHPPSPLNAMSGSEAATVDEMFVTSPVASESQREGPPWWGGPRADDLLGVASTMGCQTPASVAAAAAAARVHMLQGPMHSDLSLASSHANSFDMDQGHQNQSPYGAAPRVLPYHPCANTSHHHHHHHHQQQQQQPHRPLFPGGQEHQQQHALHAALTPPTDSSAFTSPTPQPQQTPHDPNELVCDQCNWKPRGVTENLKGYLRKHKNTHKGLRYPCDIEGCTKTFGRPDNLKAHKRDKHGVVDESSSSAASIKQEPIATMAVATVPSISAAASLSAAAAAAAAAVAAGATTGSGIPETEEAAPRESSESTFRGVLPKHAALWSGLNM